MFNNQCTWQYAYGNGNAIHVGFYLPFATTNTLVLMKRNLSYNSFLEETLSIFTSLGYPKRTNYRSFFPFFYFFF